MAESPDTPSLADRIDMTRIITAGDGHRSIVLQSSVSDSDRRAAAARLRKLDRIEAAVREHRRRWTEHTARLGNDIEQTDPLHIDRDLWDALEAPDV